MTREMCVLIYSACSGDEAVIREIKNKPQMATGLKIYLYLCTK